MAPNISLKVIGSVPEQTEKKLRKFLSSADPEKTTVESLTYEFLFFCTLTTIVLTLYVSSSELKKLQLKSSFAKVYVPIETATSLEDVASKQKRVSLVNFEERLFKVDVEVDVENVNAKSTIYSLYSCVTFFTQFAFH